MKKLVFLSFWVLSIAALLSFKNNAAVTENHTVTSGPQLSSAEGQILSVAADFKTAKYTIDRTELGTAD
jgi:hypothetical protein